MTNLIRRATTFALLVAVLTTAACQALDRAGGSAGVAVTQLRFEITSDPGRQIIAWANEVDRLSKGKLKVNFVRDELAGLPDYESRTITDVRTGRMDLAWVGARAFDQVGLTTFQPLVAPLLIDSLELEGKVFDAGIPQRMLPSVDQVGVVGIGVLPGPIRKLLGVRKPFTTPDDFTGQVIGVAASDVAAQSFRALGATTEPEAPGAPLTGLDALDQQLSSIHGNHYELHASYVTGNLNLWPRPLVIIANPDLYQRLTDDDRAIMATAAKDAIPGAMEAERKADADAITALCKAGLTFVQANHNDLAALQQSMADVYRSIDRTATNKAASAEIAKIKNAVARGPDNAECGNVPASEATNPTRYDGTYRRTLNWSTVKRCPNDAPPPSGIGTDEITFRGGTLQMWSWRQGHEDEREIGWDGTYAFFKDQLVIEDPGGRLVMDFRYDGTTLTMSNMRGGFCDDVRAWTTGSWRRQ